MPTAALTRLLTIMRALRDPETGCPWDLAQSHTTLTPYLLEEAHEAVEAIETGSDEELVKELGDVLLQVVFHSQIAEERNAFTFADVMERVAEKLVYRHPHVFGETKDAPLSPDEVTDRWEQLKLAEHADTSGPPRSVLDGVPMSMPALILAERLGAKAGRVGFDWPGPREVLEKVQEELAEVDEALRADDRSALEHEIGDLLFAVANFSRALSIDAEQVLRQASRRFTRRFRAMEDLTRERGTTLDALSPEEQEALWEEVKTTLEKG